MSSSEKVTIGSGENRLQRRLSMLACLIIGMGLLAFSSGAAAACSPACQNGGTCIAQQCYCPDGWHGADCSIPVGGWCGPNNDGMNCYPGGPLCNLGSAQIISNSSMMAKVTKSFYNPHHDGMHTAGYPLGVDCIGMATGTGPSTATMIQCGVEVRVQGEGSCLSTANGNPDFRCLALIASASDARPLSGINAGCQFSCINGKWGCPDQSITNSDGLPVELMEFSIDPEADQGGGD